MEELKYKYRIHVQGVNGGTLTFDTLNTPLLLPEGEQIFVESRRYTITNTSQVLKVNVDNSAQPIVHEIFYNVESLD